MPFCTTCGNEFDNGIKFCQSCGNATTNSEPQQNEIKPEVEKKKGNYTKEGRKIIDSGPRPNTQSKPDFKQSAMPGQPKKKKRSFLGCLGKGLLVVFALLVVGIVIIWNLPDSEEGELTGTDIPGIVDIEPESEVYSPEMNRQASKRNKPKLAPDDENAADKYRNGIEVEADQFKAVQLYEKLAKKGDLNAMIELSDYYEQGIWVKKDPKKAKKLLQKAADKGSEAAKWQLEFLDSEK